MGRIVSDFDGVFTTQEGEAAAVGEYQLELIGTALGDFTLAQEVVQQARDRVLADALHHGWWWSDLITCYADEDPYVFHNAVVACLYQSGPADVITRLKSAGFPDYNSLAQRCFVEGTERYRASHSSHLVPDAVSTLRTFAAAGTEVVVVSNSSGDRIQRIFDDFGAHAFAGISPRVRGDAKKFLVTGVPDLIPETMELGGRKVHLRRGQYFNILQEEQPSLVIGDVLSLDLALPIALRQHLPEFRHLKLFLKRAAHTPEWALQACRDHDVVILETLEALTQQVLP